MSVTIDKLISTAARIAKSDAFKIYSWPLLVAWLIYPLSAMLLFGKPEPGSTKEYLFVSIGAIVWTCCLWVVTIRYKQVKGRTIGKRGLKLLKVFTVIIYAALMLTWIIELVKFMQRA